MDSKFPERVTIETTSRCNLDCDMCYTKKCKKGEMEDDLFKKLIKECSEYKVNQIVPFFRGEPFCDSHFIERLEYIKKKLPQARIELATNGTMFPKNALEKLCEMKIDFLSFSLDTGDRNTTPNQKERAEKALEILLSKRTNEMFIQVSTVNTGQGEDTLNNFYKKWKDKVNRVRVFEQHTITGKYGKTKIERKGRTYCKKLDTDMVVYFDGTISLCCYDWGRESCEIGNANDSTLKEIWNNTKYDSIRRQHNEGKIVDRVCKDCGMWR